MASVRNCGAVLSEQAKAHPQKVFFVYGDKNVTYKEVDANSNRVANGLSDLGVKKGDKICTLMRNDMEGIYSLFGAFKIGAVFVPVNTQLQEDQIAHIINNSEASILVLEADTVAQLEAMRSKVPKITTLIVNGESKESTLWKVLNFSKLMAAKADPIDTYISNTDLACLLYTSGTTGNPKGVMLSQEYFMAGGELLTKLMSEGANDVFYATLPFYHIMGQIHGIFCPLAVGGKSVVAEKFSASRFWDEVRKFGLTACCLTGTQVSYIYQQPPKPDDAKNPLNIIMSFPVPVDIAADFEKRFDTKIRSVYGLTEALLPIVAAADEPYKIGSLGKATDYEVRIADDSDNEVAAGEPGNILIRPNVTSRRVFDGYYKMPEASLDMLKHTWFHTGDMGYRDADGIIWFASRKKDVIRFRGENVSATAVETIIGGNAKISECAIIGVPSSVGEEDVKAVLKLKDGQSMKPEEFIGFCEEKMTWFMIPRYVEFIQTPLPRNVTDKVEKNKLKANWKNAATWDRDAAGYKLKKRG